MREIQELMAALYRYFPIPDEEQRKGAAHWISCHHDAYRFKLWLSPDKGEMEYGLGTGYSSFEIILLLQQMVKLPFPQEQHPQKSTTLRDWHDLTGGEQSLMLTGLSSYPTAPELFDNNIWPGAWLHTHRGLAEDEIRQLIDEVAALEGLRGKRYVCLESVSEES